MNTHIILTMLVTETTIVVPHDGLIAEENQGGLDGTKIILKNGSLYRVKETAAEILMMIKFSLSP